MSPANLYKRCVLTDLQRLLTEQTGAIHVPLVQYQGTWCRMANSFWESVKERRTRGVWRTRSEWLA